MKRLSLFVVPFVLGSLATPANAQTAKATFTNATVNAVPGAGTVGTAATYPSTIAVTGIAGLPYHVSVTINATHTFTSDLDILLVSPGGRAVMLMSDIGAGSDLSNTSFSFDDCAPRAGFTAPVPAGGRLRPTNVGNADPMAAPAPPGPYANSLSEFNWIAPNGTWSLYVVDDATGDIGQINSWTLTFYTQPATGAPIGGGNPISCTAPDYDGDGRTDVAVYRETTGQWFIAQSGSNFALLQANWGAPALADTQVPADYDGDGITDVAVYRQATGEWFIRRSSDLTLMQVAFGAGSGSGLGDTPVPGDYDGDGQADLAIYRTTTGQWFLRSSAGQGVQTINWGFPPAHDQPARR